MIGGTWQLTAPDRSWTLAVPRLAAAMVVLPVFLQAPWVRLLPFSATLFTAVLMAVGIVLGLTADRQKAEIGQLLVGFSGSWLAGANVQVLEAKRGQLAAVRAAKASEAAHKGSLQSKQWDRGKRVHKQ